MRHRGKIGNCQPISCRNGAKYNQGYSQLGTNRKSKTRFRLVPQSSTSDDLEWPLANTHSCRKDAFFGAHHKNVNEDRLILSYWKRVSTSLSVCRHNWELCILHVPACIWQYSHAIGRFIVNKSGSKHSKSSEAVASELKIFWTVNIGLRHSHTERDNRQPETLDNSQRRRPRVWRR